MLLDPNSDPELKPKRVKTLTISIAFHLVLVALLLLRPDLLSTPPKRVIRIAGQDYNLDTTELTLAPPNLATPPPAVAKNQPPLVQPPTPAPPPQAAPPPPPPPPPDVIKPDDVIKDGARPDAAPKASRGDTQELRAGGGNPEPETPKTPPQTKSDSGAPTQITQNTNPNALRIPTYRAGSAIEEATRQAQSHLPSGPRTGVQGGGEDPNFSTEEPTILSDTKGYDFGPYMNQVVNRVRINWYQLIPEVARLGNKKGRVVIVFTITPSGAITGLELVSTSFVEPYDRAAMGAITFSNPFSKLPADFKGDRLKLQFTFIYNTNP